MAFSRGARSLASSLLLASALAGCGSSNDNKGSSGPDLCAGVSGACLGFAAGTTAASIRDKMATASAGTTFVFDTGTFKFDLPLEVTVANATIRGAGRDATLLDFKGASGSEGVFATGDGFTLKDLAIRDTAGNGVKIVGADKVTIQNVKVTWTDPDSTKHGGYGIYPVQSTHVLVEDCFTSGATDTGVYVGQSQDIIVRNNETTGNVAGIEIENSYRADVHGNDSHGNTGGILVFDLPGLQQQGGNHVRVYENTVSSNNTANFGPAGSTVALVPAGAGIVVMANHDVEVFNNTVSGNQTAAISVISYAITGLTIPAGYDPFPKNVYIHDNTLSSNGASPDPDVQLGGLLALIQATALNHDPIPDVVWDGILSPGDTGTNPRGLCVKAPATFLSLGATFGASGPEFHPSVDATDHRCTQTALPAVTAW